jgi:hypothetical protein
MRRPATMRRVPPAPTDEDFFIRLATDALTSVMADLRCRVEHTGTRRSVAQVLLAEAHVAEAVGLLRTIQPIPSAREANYQHRSQNAALYTCNRVQRLARRHQTQGVAV